MPARPAIEEWSVLRLGDDPVPGDPESVGEILRAYGDLASTADAAHRLLAASSAIDGGRGRAMEAFKDLLGKLPARLDAMADSYGGAANAYLKYNVLLEDAQRTSLEALEQAKQAAQDVGAAEATLDSARSVVQVLGRLSTTLGELSQDDADRQQRATDEAAAGAARLRDAQQALDSAKSLLGQATAVHDQAAREAAKVLRDLAHDAPQRSLWEKIREAFEAFVDFLRSTVVEWITTVLDVLSTLASLVFPPLGSVIGFVSGAVDVLSTVAAGDERGTALALSGLAAGLVPGGRLAFRVVKGVVKAAEGSVRSGVKAAGASIAAGAGKTVGGRVGGGVGARAAASGANRPPVPRDTRVDLDVRKCVTDPVDVATGEVVLREVDVEAALPLERTHVSSYRAGGWFGPSWASTLDQRLEFDEQGVCFFAPDGVVLVYPPAAPGVPVLPLEGARRPLTVHADGTALLTDPLSGRTVRFAAGTPVAHAVEVTRGQDRLLVERADDGAPVRVRWSTAGVETSVVEVTTGAGRVTSIAAPAQDSAAAPLLVLGYDERGHLGSVVNTSGLATTFTHDRDGRLTGWRDRNGVGYRYAYDVLGRCVGTDGDGGFLSSRFSFTPVPGGGSLTTYTNSLGHVSTYQLNELHQLVREVDPFGAVTTSAWDRYDRLVSTTDPLGRTTSYAHDDLGNLLRVTRPDGSVVDVHTSEDPTSAERTSISVSDGERTWWREAPDAADSARTRRVPGASEDDDEQFRPADRPRQAWAAGTVVTRTGRLGGTDRVRYDAEGNEVERTDAAGGTTRTERGAFDVVTATVDENGARTTYEHDTELRLTRVTDPLGRRWDYTYDAAGRLVEETDFDGRVLRYAYDAAGQLTRSVDAVGAVTEHVHDLLGNEVERRDGSGTTTRSYDPLGRLLSATGGGSTLVLERDDTGRVLTSTVDGRTTTFAYDDAAGTVRRRTPSGVESTWTYEGGRAVKLETAGHTTLFTHDAAGQVVTCSVDGSAALSQNFDAAGRLTGQELPDGSWRRFERRADGAITAVRHSAGGDREYDLDPTGRVLAVQGGEHEESYSYDSVGRLTGAQLLGAAATATTAGYRFDARGRVVERTVLDPDRGELVWQHTWDSHDRLTEVRTPDGEVWSYSYDPMGRRTAKDRRSTPGGPVLGRIEFSWDGRLLIEETRTDLDGCHEVTTWQYDPAGRPVAQVQSDLTGEQARFAAIVTDLLGTPSDLVDAAGSVRTQQASSLWGRPVQDGNPLVTPLRFPGQYHDPESGLHYNVFRYYDPHTASYLSQDPLGLLPAPHPTGYVTNPLSAADPLGLADCGSPGPSTGPSTLGRTSVPARPGAATNATFLTEDKQEFPLRLIRHDDDFFRSTYKGRGKSSIIRGDLVPANPRGRTTVVEHIRGLARGNESAKGNSQFTSFTPSNHVGAKFYGNKHVQVDLRMLHEDIEAGRVSEVRIVSPREIQTALNDNVDALAGKRVFVRRRLKTEFKQARALRLGSPSKTEDVARAMQALNNSRRDQEFLIEGILPKEYIRGPFDGPFKGIPE